jgi:uncharacterized protein YfaS (alpha-2-macroglobulin family)
MHIQITLYKILNPIEFLSQQKNFHKLQIEDTPVREALNYALQTSSEKNKPTIYGKPTNFSDPKQVPFQYINFWSYKTDSKAVSQYSTFSLGHHSQGLYLIEAKGKNFITYALGLVSDLSIILRRSPGKTLVYAVHASSGLPVEGVNMRFYRKSKLIQEGMSGKDGIYFSQVSYSPQYLILAQKGDQIAFCDPSYFPASFKSSKGYVFTERPLYLPGEKVYFKAIFRTEESGQYFISEISSATYQVMDGRNQMVHKGEAVLQKGACSGEFDLKKEWALGKYKLQITAGEKTFAGEFKVEEYEKPKIHFFFCSITNSLNYSRVFCI